MISVSEAFKIIKENKPGFNISNSFELPEKYAFILIPKNADQMTFITGVTFIDKNDGKITVGGLMTSDEMKKAKKLNGIR